MTSVRFLQIGDVHLARHERNAERIRALDQIIEAGLREPLAAWLLPGDLDDSLMTVENKNVWTTRAVRMAEHAPLIVVPGNHDTPGDLDFLAHLGARHRIYVVTTPQVIRIPLAVPDPQRMGMADAAIACLPYPTRMGLVAAGTPSELVPQVARQALEHLFIAFAAELQQATAEGCVPLFLGHLNVGGSITSSGQPAIGKEIELDPTLLGRLGPIYKGLNHIHRAQPIAGAYYAGSTCRLDWGEVEEKRYLLIDYDRVDFAHKGGFGEAWHYTVTSVPIAIPPRYLVEGELTRERFAWHVVANPDALIEDAIDWTGAEVRVRFTYAAAKKDALNFDLVTAPFVGAVRVETDPLPTHTRAVRAPEIAAAPTEHAKVEAFVQGAGVEWTPALDQKLALLALPDDAVFLNQLEADLRPPAEAEEPQPLEVCQ